MVAKILFGKDVIFDIRPLGIRRKCYTHIECENYSDILYYIAEKIENNRKKKILSFFTRRIYPRYFRYATIQVGGDTYRVKINYPYSLSILSDNALVFFSKISKEIMEGINHGKED